MHKSIKSYNSLVFYLISAVYLIIMFSMGVMAILLTIFVLKCHHSTEDQPIPNYIRRLCSIANKLEYSHCCKKSAVVDEIESNDKNGNKGSPRKAFQPELSWPEVTTALDKFFFKVYTTIFLLLTILVLLVFIIHYYI